MATLSRFFWEKNHVKVDTYVFDIVSLPNALEVGKALQTHSTADLIQVTFTADGGAFPSLQTDRRVVFKEDHAQKQNVDFSAYKRGGSGYSPAHYLAAWGKNKDKGRRGVTIPAPLMTWDAKVADLRSILETALRMAWRDQSYEITAFRLISPNLKRRVSA